ncbi:MAG: hypothetical protein NWF00_03355 [Candidatus Bathyarchaeota archaeon]|nr:hypothetical protein [Candidatus Bathyarchaeota archaeon]
MAKTDDILLALSRTIPDCIESVGPFKYRGKTHRLIDNFASLQHTNCDVCGNDPIFDVSVIRSEKGDRLNVCNNCIDQITSRSVSSWFKAYRKKRENVMENRVYIDGLSSILAMYERNELPFEISSKDVEVLRKTFVQMCNGLDPLTKQKQLVDCYLDFLRGEQKIEGQKITS